MVKTIPTTLQEALSLMSKGSYIPYGGGTDLMITDYEEHQDFLFLHKIPEMRAIVVDDTYVRIGASCTFTEVAEHPACHPLLKRAICEIAAPAIRNLGTIGGNIGNGSAKADSALIFFVADAKIRVAGIGGERIVPIRDFYKGRKQLDLAENELIVEVLMPKELPSGWYYKKIGARKALAISRLDFAGLMGIEDGKIVRCATAFGAVSPVIIRRPDLDAMLEGKSLSEAKKEKEAYLDAYRGIINPIRGRISAEYRKTVCMNLLEDFLTSFGI